MDMDYYGGQSENRILGWDVWERRGEHKAPIAGDQLHSLMLVYCNHDNPSFDFCLFFYYYFIIILFLYYFILFILLLRLENVI